MKDENVSSNMQFFFYCIYQCLFFCGCELSYNEYKYVFNMQLGYCKENTYVHLNLESCYNLNPSIMYVGLVQ